MWGSSHFCSQFHWYLIACLTRSRLVSVRLRSPPSDPADLLFTLRRLFGWLQLDAVLAPARDRHLAQWGSSHFCSQFHWYLIACLSHSRTVRLRLRGSPDLSSAPIPPFRRCPAAPDPIPLYFQAVSPTGILTGHPSSIPS